MAHIPFWTYRIVGSGRGMVSLSSFDRPIKRSRRLTTCLVAIKFSSRRIAFRHPDERVCDHQISSRSIAHRFWQNHGKRTSSGWTRLDARYKTVLKRLGWSSKDCKFLGRWRFTIWEGNQLGIEKDQWDWVGKSSLWNYVWRRWNKCWRNFYRLNHYRGKRC